MPDPLNAMGLGPLGPIKPPDPVPGSGASPRGGVSAGGGVDFKDLLLDKLDEVNRLQTEAGKSVEKLVTGESQNMAEVFSAVRKADVAFSLLMEIRNKLMDAYEQVQQMRV